MKKWVIILLVLLVSLFNEAQDLMTDSLLNLKRAYALNLDDPDEALSIVKNMREHGLLPDWQLDLAEGDLHTNIRMYRQAHASYKAALENPALKDSIELQMYLIKQLVGVDDRLLNDDELTGFAYRLQQMAEHAKNDYYMAQAHFAFGKRYQFHNDPKGYTECLKAVEQMRNCNHPEKINSLFRFYGDLVKMYKTDDRFQDALRMSQLQEQVARKITGNTVRNYNSYAMRHVYALRASLLAEMGRMEEADEVYALWQQTTAGNAIDDKEILDYLIKANLNDEALAIIYRYKSFLSEEGDGISHWMLTMLVNEVTVYTNMGQYEEATRLFAQMNTIADSLHKEESRQLMEMSYQLLQQREKAQQRNMWLMGVGIVLFLALLLFGISTVYNNRIRKRNQVLYNVLNGLDAYRNRVVDDSRMTDEPDMVEKPCVAENVQETQEETINTQKMEDKKNDGEPVAKARGKRRTVTTDDQQLFVEMDKVVTRDKLYLNPHLSREDLTRLLGIDKNRFGKMMSHYADANNVSVYINTKRVEYGAKLIKEHPDYTIAYISQTCGMGNTVTFNRTFKEIYGVTPSEYRKNFDEVDAKKDKISFLHLSKSNT